MSKQKNKLQTVAEIKRSLSERLVLEFGQILRHYNKLLNANNCSIDCFLNDFKFLYVLVFAGLFKKLSLSLQ